MKFYISYFYQIRFFKSHIIPVSTAKYDPKWYHDNATKVTHSNKYMFVDKNGVINGLRADELVFPENMWDELVDSNSECSKSCEKQIPCKFMAQYYDYLKTLNFKSIIDDLSLIANKLKVILHFNEEPIIVLIVHEPSTCKCAERPVLQKWFNDNGYELKEWTQ